MKRPFVCTALSTLLVAFLGTACEKDGQEKTSQTSVGGQKSTKGGGGPGASRPGASRPGKQQPAVRPGSGL
ncbi:MAG: hypothetical protein JKY56_00445, partial [Kofleriaceae bacterium]|nr:hypothetical protein [Kofleriaceae bacterium]